MKKSLELLKLFPNIDFGVFVNKLFKEFNDFLY